jgi:hypothetical protein
MSADEEREDDEREEEGTGHDRNGRHLGRFAAVAAASGATAATAIAARKAYTSRTSGDSGDKPAVRERLRSRKSNDGVSLARDAVTSGWAVAKDAVIPMVEDAAAKAGGYVAENSPELVRDVVVPKFLAGFEEARSKHAQGKQPQKKEQKEAA